MRIGMEVLFLYSSAVAVILKIQIPCHIGGIERIGNKCLRQHHDILRRMLDAVDIRFISCNNADLAASPVR